MLDRRTVLTALAAPGFAVAAPVTIALLAGGYAREGARGLARLALQPATDAVAIGGYAPVADVSYGVYARRFGRRYLVREAAVGAVAVCDAVGDPISLEQTGGSGPCFAALDQRQTSLAVANYDSGSVSLIRLDPASGAPLGPAQVVLHQGSGPVRERQAGPHAHWVGFSPDQLWLHAVDLGADAIFAHPFDAARGIIAEGQVAYAAPPGSGPRHLARHPFLPCAYLVSELANSLTVLAARPDGRFEARQVLSTLPSGFSAHSQAAHITIDRQGRRLYVSNRGANSVAVFALDDTGRASPLQHIPAGGDWPRFFLLMEPERRMLVANERSDEVAILHVVADGRLQDSGRRFPLSGVVFLMR